MRVIKQNTAANIMVFMTDSADHVSGKAGLTLAITISKDGGVFSSISPTVSDRGNGWYNLALVAGNTDTLGDVAIHVTATGADPSDLVCRVVTKVFDDLAPEVGGNIAAVKSKTDNLPADPASNTQVNTRLATAGYTAPDNSSITAIKAKTDNLPTDPADESVLEGLITAVDSVVDAIKLKTDLIPATPATEGSVTSRPTLAQIEASTVLAKEATVLSRAAEEGGIIRLEVMAGLESLSLDLDTKLNTSSYTAPDNAGVAAIKAKTDNLPADPASNSQVNTRLAASGYTAPDNTGIAGIKAKTDALPANPSSEATIVAVGNIVSNLPTLAEIEASTIIAKQALLQQISERTENLPSAVKKNAALNNFMFTLIDSSDHITPKVGATVSGQKSIDGAAFSACAGVVSEVGNGVYKINLAPSDLNGDVITFLFNGPGVDPSVITILTKP